MDCNICPEYIGGEGTKTCLVCEKYRWIGYERSQVNMGYYSHEALDKLAVKGGFIVDDGESEHPVWAYLQSLDNKTATVLMQKHCLCMTPEEIAAYHDINLTTVYRIFKRVGSS